MADNRVALVTGGSTGIGRAASLRLAGQGAMVAVNYLGDPGPANSLVEEINQAGGSAIALAGDITDLADNRRLFDEVVEKAGGLDILVNNAGVSVVGSFTEIDEQAYDRLFAITKGTYFAMANAARHLRDGGRIISVSSGLTRNWAHQHAAYAGSKAAIEQFTRSLSKELGPRNITVNAVLPGLTRTPMTHGNPDAVFDASSQQSSLGRVAEPEDIADVIAFLASNDARWITGQFIVANGGTTP